MLPNKREMLDFNDAIKDQQLPIYLQVTSECTLNKKIVLEKDQRLTVLDRGEVDLLFGRDWNDKTFRLAKQLIQDYHVDIVQEYYPTTLDELRTAVEQSNYIQTKTEFQDDCYQFACFEMFQFTEFLDETRAMFVMQNTKGKFCVSSKVIMDPNNFVFVKIKEVKRIRDFIRSFKPNNPNLLCFRDPGSGVTLPLGNVKIESIANYEIAYTVTSINKDRELKYETFPVDKRIQVRRCGSAIPKHVQVFGPYNSDGYRAKLKEIKTLMNYDLHAPRFYAYLIIENHLYVPEIVRQRPQALFSEYSKPTFQRPNHVENDKNSTIRESIRRMFKLSTKDKLKSPQKSSEIPINNFGGGIYRPVDESVASKATDVEATKVKSEEFQKRSKSDSTKSVTIDRQENPLYGLDTITLEKLKQQRRLSTSPISIHFKDASVSEMMKKRKIKPPRPKSFDLDQSFFFHSHEEELERPFAEVSPLGKREHISDSNIDDICKRSPSLPARRIPLRRPVQFSRSVSPPRPENLFDLDFEPDSGVDSPDDPKNYEQITKAFQAKNESRARAQSALENRLPQGNEISWPFNVKHLTSDEKKVKSPVYDIPKRPMTSFLENFDQLDRSNNFPELRNFEMWRSQSEPFLNIRTDKTRRKDLPIYEEVIYGDVKSQLSADVNSRQKRELNSLAKIKTYSISEISQLLQTLKLDRHVNIFAGELITGSFLLNLTEETLCNDLKMTPFEARKLYKYMHGWRPNMNRGYVLPFDKVGHMDRDEWTISDVENQLKMIKLPEFATFCVNNLIDGALLLHLVHEQMIPTMEQDGVKLTNIEMERLRMYFMREISYDEEDKSFLGQS